MIAMSLKMTNFAKTKDMTINKPNGYMYKFVTGTWNPISGKCPHRCAYCYMIKPYSEQPPIHLREKEFDGEFHENDFIFIGSGTDMFAEQVPSEWIRRVLDFCVSASSTLFNANQTKFLLQSKNPARILEFTDHSLFKNGQVVACTTIETNRHYSEFMGKAPLPQNRAEAMALLSKQGVKTFVTVEPIMDFDLEEMVGLIEMCNPEQVNIGKNSKDFITLPNPTLGKTVELVKELLKFTKVEIKENSGKLKQALKQLGIEPD